MAAKKKSKSKSKSKSPARRRKQSVGFLKSAEGKMLVHAGVGAVVLGQVKVEDLEKESDAWDPDADAKRAGVELGDVVEGRPDRIGDQSPY